MLDGCEDWCPCTLNNLGEHRDDRFEGVVGRNKNIIDCGEAYIYIESVCSRLGFTFPLVANARGNNTRYQVLVALLVRHTYRRRYTNLTICNMHGFRRWHLCRQVLRTTTTLQTTIFFYPFPWVAMVHLVHHQVRTAVHHYA